MTDYSKLKVTELKDIVKDRGIASTGLKLKQNFVDALVKDDEVRGVGGGGEEGGEEVVEKEELVGAKEEDKNEVVQDEKAEVPAKEEDEKVELPAKTEEDMVEEEKRDLSEEPSNKRKRRSPTPPLSQESVNKRIRTAEEKSEAGVTVKLPEDVDTDAPAPVEDETAPPPVTSDIDGSAAQKDNVEEPKSTNEQHEEPQPIAHGDTIPSRHPITAAVYIRDLVRPLQPNTLREHLLSVAQTSGAADATILEFHLDRIRTHAFVLFDSASAASAVRRALHNQIWPDEPMRKPLWIDYIPEESVREWIDTEVNSGDQQKRWEVVYSSTGLDTDGPVTATLQEADGASGNARNNSRQAPGSGEGMPNAPSGPRRQSSQPQPSRSPEETRRPPNKSNDTLDEMYPFTSTKPKIYYQPVNRELIERRLEEFEKEKSRDWDDRFADPSAYAEGELRRYTFEDGDRLVDGGADFGLFGRSSRGGGGGGGGRGGGRGRGRGGDRYRGSARR